MVDKTGLQIIGWVFGGTTMAVVLIATLLVGSAIASGGLEGGDATTGITSIADGR